MLSEKIQYECMCICEKIDNEAEDMIFDEYKDLSDEEYDEVFDELYPQYFNEKLNDVEFVETKIEEVIDELLESGDFQFDYGHPVTITYQDVVHYVGNYR